MSISFVTGKPGAGKGLVAMQQIIDELVHGTRPVVTNLAVHIDPWWDAKYNLQGGLSWYLFKKYGKDFDVRNRVFVLADDAIESFFLWRVVKGASGSAVECAPAQTVERGGDTRVVGFDTSLGRATGGHLYVVDEAWRFYGSRSWQKTGEGLLFYNAQHRKFGDDVLIVTQHTKQIDAAVQRVAQDFWVVKNHSKLSIGMFRQPDVFSISIFEDAPTGSQMSPMARRMFRLDKGGVAQTYDTSAGVGLSGRAMADVGSRRRGLPWWGLLVFVVLLAAGVWYALRTGGWLIGRSVSGVLPPVKSVSPVVPTQVSSAGREFPGLVGRLPGVGVVSDGMGRVRDSVGFGDREEVKVTGVCKIPGGDCVVSLSDGRNVSASSGRVGAVNDSFCVVDGCRFNRLQVAPELPFVEHEIPSYDYPAFSPPRPVNQAQVTVIGSGYRNRSAVGSSGLLGGPVGRPGVQSAVPEVPISSAGSGDVVQGHFGQ